MIILIAAVVSGIFLNVVENFASRCHLWRRGFEIPLSLVQHVSVFVVVLMYLQSSLVHNLVTNLNVTIEGNMSVYFGI